MNNQQLYNSISDDIKKISSRSHIDYKGGEYIAVIYSSDHELYPNKKKLKSKSMKGLRDELDLFLYGEC